MRAVLGASQLKQQCHQHFCLVGVPVWDTLGACHHMSSLASLGERWAGVGETVVVRLVSMASSLSGVGQTV